MTKHPFCEHDAISPGYGCAVCGDWRFSDDLQELLAERDAALAKLGEIEEFLKTPTSDRFAPAFVSLSARFFPEEKP